MSRHGFAQTLQDAAGEGLGVAVSFVGHRAQ